MNRKFNLAIVSKNNKVFLQRVMTLFYKRDYLIHNMSVDFSNQSGYRHDCRNGNYNCDLGYTGK